MLMKKRLKHLEDIWRLKHLEDIWSLNSITSLFKIIFNNQFVFVVVSYQLHALLTYNCVFKNRAFIHESCVTYTWFSWPRIWKKYCKIHRGLKPLIKTNMNSLALKMNMSFLSIMTFPKGHVLMASW
jgi:hypothetical protein